jgi:hypothetical protein
VLDRTPGHWEFGDYDRLIQLLVSRLANSTDNIDEQPYFPSSPCAAVHQIVFRQTLSRPNEGVPRSHPWDCICEPFQLESL